MYFRPFIGVIITPYITSRAHLVPETNRHSTWKPWHLFNSEGIVFLCHQFEQVLYNLLVSVRITLCGTFYCLWLGYTKKGTLDEICLFGIRQILFVWCECVFLERVASNNSVQTAKCCKHMPAVTGNKYALLKLLRLGFHIHWQSQKTPNEFEGNWTHDKQLHIIMLMTQNILKDLDMDLGHAQPISSVLLEYCFFKRLQLQFQSWFSDCKTIVYRPLAPLFPFQSQPQHAYPTSNNKQNSIYIYVYHQYVSIKTSAPLGCYWSEILQFFMLTSASGLVSAGAAGAVSTGGLVSTGGATGVSTTGVCAGCAGTLVASDQRHAASLWCEIQRTCRSMFWHRNIRVYCISKGWKKVFLTVDYTENPNRRFKWKWFPSVYNEIFQVAAYTNILKYKWDALT